MGKYRVSDTAPLNPDFTLVFPDPSAPKPRWKQIGIFILSDRWFYEICSWFSSWPFSFENLQKRSNFQLYFQPYFPQILLMALSHRLVTVITPKKHPKCSFTGWISYLCGFSLFQVRKWSWNFHVKPHSSLQNNIITSLLSYHLITILNFVLYCALIFFQHFGYFIVSKRTWNGSKPLTLQYAWMWLFSANFDDWRNKDFILNLASIFL